MHTKIFSAVSWIFTVMKVQELCSFLVRSKISTYSSGRKGTVLEDGSKELVFEEKDFRYRDKYFGFNPFLGQEVVFQKRQVLWGMNYYGGVFSKDVLPEETYDFLREALRRINEESPLRGPENYANGHFCYVNCIEGTIIGFRGTEKISFKGREIYRLFYHGGIIQGNPNFPPFYDTIL